MKLNILTVFISIFVWSAIAIANKVYVVYGYTETGMTASEKTLYDNYQFSWLWKNFEEKGYEVLYKEKIEAEELLRLLGDIETTAIFYHGHGAIVDKQKGFLSIYYNKKPQVFNEDMIDLIGQKIQLEKDSRDRLKTSKNLKLLVTTACQSGYCEGVLKSKLDLDNVKVINSNQLEESNTDGKVSAESVRRFFLSEKFSSLLNKIPNYFDEQITKIKDTHQSNLDKTTALLRLLVKSYKFSNNSQIFRELDELIVATNWQLLLDNKNENYDLQKGLLYYFFKTKNNFLDKNEFYRLSLYLIENDYSKDPEFYNFLYEKKYLNQELVNMLFEKALTNSNKKKTSSFEQMRRSNYNLDELLRGVHKNRSLYEIFIKYCFSISSSSDVVLQNLLKVLEKNTNFVLENESAFVEHYLNNDLNSDLKIKVVLSILSKTKTFDQKKNQLVKNLFSKTSLYLLQEFLFVSKYKQLALIELLTRDSFWKQNQIEVFRCLSLLKVENFKLNKEGIKNYIMSLNYISYERLSNRDVLMALIETTFNNDTKFMNHINELIFPKRKVSFLSKTISILSRIVNPDLKKSTSQIKENNSLLCLLPYL